MFRDLTGLLYELSLNLVLDLMEGSYVNNIIIFIIQIACKFTAFINFHYFWKEW